MNGMAMSLIPLIPAKAGTQAFFNSARDLSRVFKASANQKLLGLRFRGDERRGI
jgi:hypothetical protein